MKLPRPMPAFSDERGVITDLLVKEPIEHVTMITSRKGARRGDHYHLETIQFVYVLQGKMQLLSQMPDCAVISTVLDQGDLGVTQPIERHTLIALEDSILLVFTRGPRGGQDYEKDTYRLAMPLKASSSHRAAGPERKHP